MITKIIVEGPDCSGKSTVINRIKNELKWDAKSLHHKSGNQFRRYLQEYALAENVVFDRSHFSEIVYANMWRGGNPFDKTENLLLNQLAQYQSLIIFCCPDLEILKERYISRNYEQQIKLTELEQSRNLFLSALGQVPHLIYFSRDLEELEFLLDKVRGFMQ